MAKLNSFEGKKFSTGSSLKFGFVGLGMGGCSIASDCASISQERRVKGSSESFYPYSALLVNTNSQDFERLSYTNRKIQEMQLTGYERGAARDVSVGAEAFDTHKDHFIERVKDQFSNNDFVWIVCGLGGGTGTGALLGAIQEMYKNGFKNKIGLILTLPRDAEGQQVSINALQRLQQIMDKAWKRIGAIVVVDNDKLYKEFIANDTDKTLSEYASYSNKFVAEVLHELNAVTSSFTPYGDSHFDSSEFEKFIKKPGILSFSKLSLKEESVNPDDPLTYVSDLEKSISEGVLSKDYNFDTAKLSAVSVVSSKKKANNLFTMTFNNNIEEVLSQSTQFSNERPVATYVDEEETSEIHFYSILSGMDLPKRIQTLVSQVEQMDRKKREVQSAEDETLKSLSSFKILEEEEDADIEGDDLFGEVHSNKSKEDDDDDLFQEEATPSKKKKKVSYSNIDF